MVQTKTSGHTTRIPSTATTTIVEGNVNSTSIDVERLNVEVALTPQQMQKGMTHSGAKSPMSNVMYDGTFWIYILIAALIILVCFWIAGVSDSQTYWRSLSKVSWANNMWFLGIITGVAIVLMVVAVYLAVRCCSAAGDQNGVNMLYISLALQAILLALGFAVLFRQKSPSGGFYFTIAIAAVTIWQFYLIWRAKSQTGQTLAIWLEVIWAIWVIFAIGLSYNIWSSNK